MQRSRTQVDTPRSRHTGTHIRRHKGRQTHRQNSNVEKTPVRPNTCRHVRGQRPECVPVDTQWPGGSWLAVPLVLKAPSCPAPGTVSASGPGSGPGPHPCEQRAGERGGGSGTGRGLSVSDRPVVRVTSPEQAGRRGLDTATDCCLPGTNRVPGCPVCQAWSGHRGHSRDPQNKELAGRA